MSSSIFLSYTRQCEVSLSISGWRIFFFFWNVARHAVAEPPDPPLSQAMWLLSLESMHHWKQSERVVTSLWLKPSFSLQDVREPKAHPKIDSSCTVLVEWIITCTKIAFAVLTSGLIGFRPQLGVTEVLTPWGHTVPLGGSPGHLLVTCTMFLPLLQELGKLSVSGELHCNQPVCHHPGLWVSAIFLYSELEKKWPCQAWFLSSWQVFLYLVPSSLIHYH